MNDVFGNLSLGLAQANQRNPTLTRAQWNEQLVAEWAKIGAPGEASAKDLGALLKFVTGFRAMVESEDAQARQQWQDLRATRRRTGPPLGEHGPGDEQSVRVPHATVH